MATKETTDAKKNGVETSLDKRVTRLEAIVRKIKAKAEIHWGDIDMDGKIGTIAVMCLLIPALSFGATETLVDWTAGQHSTATAKVVIVTGGSATMIVDNVQGDISKCTGTPTAFGINATNVTAGNLAQARISNALGTAGSLIGGNVPIAAVSNAMGSAGATIGGNVSATTISNAVAHGAFTAIPNSTNGLVTGQLFYQSINGTNVIHIF